MSFSQRSVVLALALRVALFSYQTFDTNNFLGPWYEHLCENGFKGFQTGFSNYTPPYLYLPWLATYLPLPKLYAIKSISLLFDFALAFVVLLLVRLKYDRRPIWLAAFAAVLFAPSIFFNSALWVNATPSTRRSCSRRSTASSGARSFSSPSRLPSRSSLCFSFRFSSCFGPKGSCR